MPPLFRQVFALLLFFSGVAAATDFPNVEVNGLLGKQAVLTINGKQQILRIGQKSLEGIQLVSATLSHAVVSYRGTTRKLGLSQRVAGNYKAVEENIIRISADQQGQFRAQITISGHPVSALVDTGASVIAMSSVQADRLGIDYLSGLRGQVVTANGRATSHFVDLPEVTLGAIVKHNVRAAVVSGLYPKEVLLGTSFLSGLSVEKANGVMSLKQGY